ncbi:MAG TPA: hypothetical protein VEY09_16190 [Pyrinomonadaceae bacterium]|nr:hypothetical protein [Pyrinomonadaceae bacterium]
MLHNDLFDPYDRLVRIEVLGRTVEVPEHNRLLRCFQFLSLESISMGDFCWNGDCTNCQVWYRDPNDTGGPERTALACRFDVREGITITRLSPHVHILGVTDCGGRSEETAAGAAGEDAGSESAATGPANEDVATGPAAEGVATVKATEGAAGRGA